MDASIKPRQVLADAGCAEFTEKKSRFLGQCIPVETEAEALAFLESVRTEHRGATHNVYAYRLYENNLCRHSDDGEPSGTAGMPLLESFLRREVYDFCCVATRYFGGILLGAGGLVRAYAHTGAIALDAGGIATLRLWRCFSLACPYALYEIINRLLQGLGAVLDSTDFAENVTLQGAVADEQWPLLQTSIREATSDTIAPIDGGPVLKKFRNGN